MFKKLIVTIAKGLVQTIVNPITHLVIALLLFAVTEEMLLPSWYLLAYIGLSVSALAAVAWWIETTSRDNPRPVVDRITRIAGFAGLSIAILHSTMSFSVVDIKYVGPNDRGSFAALRILGTDGAVQRVHVRNGGWENKPCATCIDHPLLKRVSVTARFVVTDADGLRSALKASADVRLSDNDRLLYELFYREKDPQRALEGQAAKAIEWCATSHVKEWMANELLIGLRCPIDGKAYSFDRIIVTPDDGK